MFETIRSRRRSFIYFPLILYWVILFIATSIPAQSMPEMGISDKFNHLLAYLILGALLFFAFKFQEKYQKLKNHAGLASFLLATIYGAFDELHQMLIPGRSAEFLDWIADLLGSLLGVIIASYLIKWQEKKDLEKNI